MINHPLEIGMKCIRCEKKIEETTDLNIGFFYECFDSYPELIVDIITYALCRDCKNIDEDDLWHSVMFSDDIFLQGFRTKIDWIIEKEL